MKVVSIFTFFFCVFFTTATAKPGSRVIGGINAPAGHFPFAAAIHVQTATSRFFCGGALLRNQWVLTSGHCVHNATLFTIQLGSSTLTGDDPNRITVATSDYYIFPDFNPDTIQNDLGLIKLRMNVTYTDYIQPLKIYPGTVFDFDPVTVLGWGQTSDSVADMSEHLQYTQLIVLTNEECKITYGNQVSENMICAEGNYNEGTCTGDNGGPLLQSLVGSYYLVGVASFISGNGCEGTDPSGFTRTAPYFVWIRDTMDGNPWV